MPEAEVVIESVKKTKEGTSAKGPWTLWHISDGNQTRYATFNKAQAELAGTLVGKRAKVTFEETERGNNIKELAGPLAENGDTPPLGTGDYVKGQTAPKDRRGMNAAVALKAAAEMTPHLATPSTQNVLLAADFFFEWLNKRSEGDQTPTKRAADSDDVPF